MIILIFGSMASNGATYNFSASVSGTAHFRMWIPDDAGTIRGVLHMVNPENSDGRSWTDDTHLRTLVS